MNNGDNNTAPITKLLEKNKYCRRIQIRLPDFIREDLQKVLCRVGYLVDGYTHNEIVKACIIRGLEAFRGAELELSKADLLRCLKRGKQKPGRPKGSPNKHIKW